MFTCSSLFCYLMSFIWFMQFDIMIAYIRTACTQVALVVELGEPNGDVLLDGVAFLQMDWLSWGRIINSY